MKNGNGLLEDLTPLARKIHLTCLSAPGLMTGEVVHALTQLLLIASAMMPPEYFDHVPHYGEVVREMSADDYEDFQRVAAAYEAWQDRLRKLDGRHE